MILTKLLMNGCDILTSNIPTRVFCNSRHDFHEDKSKKN